MKATHFIEQWKDKDGVYQFTKVKPINEFNVSLTKSRYGFKTIAVLKIAFKDSDNKSNNPDFPDSSNQIDSTILAEYDNQVKATIIQQA